MNKLQKETVEFLKPIENLCNEVSNVNTIEKMFEKLNMDNEDEKEDIRKRYNNNYTPYNYRKHGYIYDNNNDYMLLYKKQYGRNRWRYYVKKKDILIPLKEYENKDIYNDHIISLPFNNINYTFRELDN